MDIQYYMLYSTIYEKCKLFIEMFANQFTKDIKRIFNPQA